MKMHDKWGCGMASQITKMLGGAHASTAVYPRDCHNIT